MTAQTNEQVVAQLYWTLRAIKEATGITTRCWRPPYGDVDDRVRAIAWQMGMQTILWDEDTNDWNMPGDGGGNLSPSKVDGYFEGWIKSQQSGKETHGHIVLEHELNNATVKMTEKWLPKLQETFNVNTIQHCMNISQPYWETNWVYPTAANPNPVSNSSTTNSTSTSSDDGTSTTITLGSTASATLASATPASQTSEAAPSSTVNVSNNVAVNSASSKSVGAGAFLMAAAIASYLF